MAIELSELELAWPARLFAAEARELLAAGMVSEESLGSLMDEAFHGNAGRQLLQEEAAKAPLGRDPWDETPRRSRAADLVNSLAEQSDQLRRGPQSGTTAHGNSRPKPLHLLACQRSSRH